MSFTIVLMELGSVGGFDGIKGFSQNRGLPMSTDPNALLFALRDRGKVLSTFRSGEMLYELDGKRYRYFLTPGKDRHPGKGPWRAEEIETNG